MKVPVSWLREYVTFRSTLSDLAERLAVASAEIERIAPRGVPDVDSNLANYVVGTVLHAVKHPNADRLQLCQVDVGGGVTRQIVCGAWNFGTGATVCVAAPGAILPGGRRLERATLRGEPSEGMILAEDELGLGPDHEGIVVLPDGLVAGTPLADLLPIADQVIELEVTGNRPDLLGVYGLAREVAALVDGELAPPPGSDPPHGDEQVAVEVEDPVGCPRYVGRLFRSVGIGPSPHWLRWRLLGAGVRAISNVVDVTNYVMLVFGSPLHAFDAERLGGGRIVVRRARDGEELVTLDGTPRRLGSGDLLICDARGPIALAGIMGGLETEVADTTTDVLLEAANFEPTGILATSQRLGLRTEGSNRWEKGVDPHAAGLAAALASELIVDVAAGRLVGHVDRVGDLAPPPTTTLRPARASALVGVEIPADEQRGSLTRLGFVVDAAAEPWAVAVPTWRARDVTREIDLVEEVARAHGLERVPFTLPERRAMFGRLTQPQRLRRRVEDILTGCGFTEAYTWSLQAIDPEPRALRLPEPLSAEHAILRTTLLHGLVDAARRNVDAGNAGVALFEIARVYLPTEGSLPAEPWRVGGITEGGFFRAKGAVEALHEALGIAPSFRRATDAWLHPGRAARVDAGWVGELHPALDDGDWGVFELDLAMMFEDVPERVEFEDVITYPALRQDLAFVVPEEVAAGDLVEAAHEAAGPLLREARVFDVYRGDQLPAGTKSVAIAVAFQSHERTLSDEDGRKLRETLVNALVDRYDARLR